jgi:citrate lyase gamma subunit
LLKLFNNGILGVATVNFSVPDEVKEAFNKEFEGQNKSAVIAELMRKAVENAQAQRQRAQAIDEILEARKHAKPITEEEFRHLREEGRP